MHTLLKWVMAVLCCFCIVGGTAAGAADATLISESNPSETVSQESAVPWWTGDADASVLTGNTSESIFSPTLLHLAEETDMAVAAKVGELYYFDAKDFRRAMNLSEFSYITVTSIPDATDGTLFLGASAVKSGQVISAGNLEKMTYSSASTSEGVGTFEFSVDGKAYSVECRVYTVKELGDAPTSEYAPVSSLTFSTHRELSFEGEMSGYDPDGDALVFEIVSAPEHGAVRILDRMAGTYVYTPYSGYTGEDSFSYVVRDSYGNYSKSREVRLTVTEPTVDVSFSDLFADKDLNDAITMTEHEIMSGTRVGSETFFYPDKTVSREDFLVMAMRTVGISVEEGDASTVFVDHSEISAPLRSYVKKAYEMGIIHGTLGKEGLYFQPSRAVTRAEAAKILSGLIGASDVMTSEIKAPTAQTVAAIRFDDQSTIPAWAEEAIYHLSAIGIFPTEDGKADVTAALTRAEAAEMFASLLTVMG